MMTTESVHVGQRPTGLYWSLWWFFSLSWLYHVTRAVWIFLNQIYVIPVHFVYMLILSPISLISKDIFWRIEEACFGSLLAMVGWWSYTAGYVVQESGDRLDHYFDETLLFIPNHQSTGDVPFCIHVMAARSGYGDRVMWVMDNVFKYTNFGVVSWMHDDFFIRAGKETRDQSLVEFRKKLTSVFVQKKRKCLGVFPEGGFLRKRRAVSNRFAEKNGLPPLEYVTLPRTGALEVIMDVLVPKRHNIEASSQQNGNAENTLGRPSEPHLAMSENERIFQEYVEANPSGFRPRRVMEGSSRFTTDLHVELNGVGSQSTSEPEYLPLPRQSTFSDYKDRLTKVVDVTIAYPSKNNPLGLFDIVTGWSPPAKVHFHYRVFDINELPIDPEGLRQWMYHLYIDKDAMLEEYYRTGVFPHQRFNPRGHPPRQLKYNTLRMLVIHAFYLVSTYLFCLMVIMPVYEHFKSVASW